MTSWDTIWERLSRGGHSVVLGCHLPPPPTLSLRLVDVDCAASFGEEACIEEARRRVAGGVGAAASYWESALGQVRRSVRRHLLNEFGPPERFERYLEAFSLARGTKPPTVLVLRSVDRADAASLQVLRRILTSPFGLPIATLFCFESDRPTSADAVSLLNLLKETLPTAAVVQGAGEPRSAAGTRADALGRAEPAATPRTSVTTTSVATTSTDSRQAGPLAQFEALGSDLKTVLRAAATMGSPFESEALATLLHLDEAEVLTRLQQAADAGIDFEDHGEGRFRWSDDWVAILRDSTLPSLREAWSQRLAEFFGGLPVPEPSAEGDSEPTGSQHEPASRASQLPREIPAPPLQDELLERSKAPEARLDEVDWHAALPDLAAADTSTSDPRRVEPRSQPASSVPSVAAYRPRVPLQSPAVDATPRPKDRARAAAYSEQAGRLTHAADAYIEAARDASDNGSFRRAEELVERARNILAQLPDNDAHRHLEALALLTLASARWQAAGNDPNNSLESALDTLAASKPLLTERSDPDLLVQYAAVAAGICYDIGTADALESALQELSDTGKRLIDARHPLHAARLLNDEAAIWVRLGDPVRAHHLLTRARAVFGKLIASRPEAPRELAETEHLTARLMLHARARPGREREAMELGIEHALSAEEGYRSLQDERSLARVWETLARLETRLDRFDSAASHLNQARAAQLRRGDGVGLARSAAAYAELHARAGSPERALDELTQSMANNEQKGSIAGLAFNSESLRQLLPQLPAATQPQARALQARLQRLLGQSDWQ